MKFRFVFFGPNDDHSKPIPGFMDSANEKTPPSPADLYQIQGNHLVRLIPSADGSCKPVIIANFHARIMHDILIDDGVARARHFVISASLEQQTVTLELSAAEFGRMGWVLSQLGPRAIIYPGQQQHVRAAIQSLSRQIEPQRIFTHLGWRREGNRWVYLHGHGALGAGSITSSWQVRLPSALRDYQLIPALDGQQRMAAMRASLAILKAAPDRISFPLLAAVYRAALGAPQFSIFVSGPSGVFKSALAAVCQQHFGAAMDAEHLPANFASTSNALEWLAFAAKDALLVVDDYAPTGGLRDRELDGIADRLFRAAGNRQGRHRLGPERRVDEPRPPRALILATGETVPGGQSLRARLLIIEMGPGDVNQSILGECQRAGQEGLLACAMAAFVGWVAERYPELQEQNRRRVTELRQQSERHMRHARTPTAVAELQSGFEIFLRYAVDTGVISQDEQEVLGQRCVQALAEAFQRQGRYQQATDPAVRFLALLQSALAGGAAHVADKHGKVPPEGSRRGWRARASGPRWSAQGVRIGWVVGDDVYLDPLASFKVAQRQAGAGGLSVSPQKLRQCLHQRGWLASVDVGRNMLQVRKTLDGQQRQVLHLRAGHLLP